MANADIREHISRIERDKWDKVVVDFANHLGSGGRNNHHIADGRLEGFTLYNFDKNAHDKLASCEWGALNNPHPATHPYTMITGLGPVAHSNSYNDLYDKPIFPQAANGCDAATVGGIRITIGTSTPLNPVHGKELFINPVTQISYVFWNSEWFPIAGVFN